METKTVEIEGKYQVQVRAPKYDVWTDEGKPFGELKDAMAHEAELKLKEREESAPHQVVGAVNPGQDDKRSAKDRKAAAEASVSPQVAQTGQQQAEGRMER